MYEHRRMIVWMVGLVAGLVLLGWRMSAMRDTTHALAEARQELGSVGEAITGAIGGANHAAALASVQRAVVVYSTDAGYCVQAGQTPAVADSSGAGPVPGSCP